jgi:hypothetical protein
MTQPRSSLVARVARLTSEAERARSPLGGYGRTTLIIGLGTVALLSLASSVRVAEAQPAPASVSPASAGVELASQMAELERRAQRLEAEYASLSMSSAPQPTGENSSTRRLEVEQELRHVRQMQAFIEASAASDQ